MSSCWIVDFFGHQQSGHYEFKNDCLIVYGEKRDHILSLDRITGLDYAFFPEFKYSSVTIETDEKLRQHWSPHYLTLILETPNLVREFTSNNATLHHLTTMMYEGLPTWASYLPRCTPRIRKSIQTFLILVEIIIFFWTLCLVLTHFNCTFTLLTKSLSFVENQITMIGLLAAPSAIVWQWCGNCGSFMNSLLGLIKKVIPSSEPSIDFKAQAITIWETLLIPLRYLFILIRAPQTGELGRRVNLLSHQRRDKHKNK